MGSLMHVDLPYLWEMRDRYGRTKIYVRRAGKYVRLTAIPGSAEFAAEYTAAVASLAQGRRNKSKRSTLPEGTLRWLAAAYFGSPEFGKLNQTSQRTRRAIIEECLRQATKAGPIANCPINKLTAQHVRFLMDAKAALPGAANNRKKYLQSMFAWAIDRGHMTVNPARDVRKASYATDGFHTWTSDEVARFEGHFPIGTKPRLALALLLYLGIRRGDMVTLGRQHVRDGWISFVPRKTSYRRRTMSQKPILPELVDIIARSQTGDLTFLVTEYGKPFSAAGFGNWFREQCNKAGLLQCTAHGLRKAGATRAAENGATVHQLMAIYDWTTPAQAEVYTRTADRKRMAGDAMVLLSGTKAERAK